MCEKKEITYLNKRIPQEEALFITFLLLIVGTILTTWGMFEIT